MTEGSAVVTILFTDLVASTELLARAGDEDAQRIFRAHHDLLEAATAHGGEEVKWGPAGTIPGPGTSPVKAWPTPATAGTRPGRTS